jgi:hypothetical protein
MLPYGSDITEKSFSLPFVTSFPPRLAGHIVMHALVVIRDVSFEGGSGLFHQTNGMKPRVLPARPGNLQMQLCLTLEHRFLQTPDQKVWTITQCPYDFYREYLDVFDSVRVISRAFPVPCVEPNFLPVEGPGVEFYTMPGYKGPFGFLGNFVKVRERAKGATVSPDSAVLFRLPSQVANSVEYWLSRRRLPYAVEVVADPYDVLGPAANRHVVAPIARRYFTRKLQQQCRRAIAVSYVTQSYLQNRYPPASDHSAAK